MIIDKIVVKQRLAMLIESKSQNEKRIGDLDIQAKILRKRLQIDTE